MNSDYGKPDDFRIFLASVERVSKQCNEFRIINEEFSAIAITATASHALRCIFVIGGGNIRLSPATERYAIRYKNL